MIATTEIWKMTLIDECLGTIDENLENIVIQLKHFLFSDDCTFTIHGHADSQNEKVVDWARIVWKIVTDLISLDWN